MERKNEKPDFHGRRSYVRAAAKNAFFCTEFLYRKEHRMAQINIHTTDEFEADLLAIMATAGVFGKSKAIRFAVHEAAEAFRDSERRRAEAANAGSDASR